MLSESSYRHEVEADIEPFRGLFLGLFFVAVGLSLDLAAVWANVGLIAVAVPLLIVVKGLVIYAVSRLFRTEHPVALRIAFAMAQHGEFGFVLFAAASSAAILAPETASVAVAIVTLSMALSSQSERALRLVRRPPEREEMEEDYADAGGAVLIVGFGRVGQMVAQPLVAEGLPVTLLDHDADRIREAGRFGRRVHFGDGTRRDVLQAAGAAEARAVAVCTDDPAATDAVVAVLRRAFPGVRVLARAYDRIHAIQLLDAGADTVVRETAEGGLALGAEALAAMGYDEAARAAVLGRVRAADEARLAAQREAAHGAGDRAATVAALTPEPVGRRQAAE